MNILLALLYSSIIPITVVLIVWSIAKNRKTTPNIYFVFIIILCCVGNIVLIAITEMLLYRKCIFISFYLLSIVVVALEAVKIKKQLKSNHVNIVDKDEDKQL